ncbi:endolytic transglycosylase MltG [Acinetobacter apis]|uniref:Endolytic murein transglycosylase n=1 Tax=Acinetobacter apis TaxID=1229165 RepID=A0A217ED75_9GAMM|nr:endolytic transglycosylase MltG [Acinetobacter apis]SNQ28433.1 UPF0755 protein [Acinetobacter apis]
MSATPTHKKKRGLWSFKTLCVCFIALILMAILVYSLSLGRHYPVQGEKQFVSIRKGDTYSALIDRLAEKNQIDFAFIVKAYRHFMIRGTLKAGVYEIEKGMSVKDVLRFMSNAENSQMNTIMVIDGTTSKQLLARLRQDPFVKKTIVHLPEAEIIKALGIPYPSLEGLFAPNTYFFSKGETDERILMNLYHRQMDELDQAWEGRAKDLPYKNKYEALIMASIIKKETSLNQEANQVAGVFIRRLKLGMRLQTDPTVIYGMGDQYQGNITRKDLTTPTPYNTYTNAGLPPTPIALPDSKSIEAAMHPDQSKNIYFVATGHGGHTFSENLADHNRAVQSYLSVLKSKKDGVTP